ncbi:hypothetical protein EXIGLDRAFT_776490 [Exidia glandulosa HHB12029]|uniref:Uncharacterized protein n=1 Tax=Exidia glandulosa HHB12029 TaxID=1314781 RepID=A0A165DG44_EXIGL|nr:hypothetical protein EXIGLDRAFT_776490 [Exidia glandulosa HHB12029]
MAFLALTRVDTTNEPGPLVWKMFSISSTIFSITTVITSMLLVQSYQSMKSLSAQEANKHLSRYEESHLGLFGTAAVFSMPFATLMWSLVTFTVAILGYSLHAPQTPRSAVLLLTITTLFPVAVIILCQTMLLGRHFGCYCRRRRRSPSLDPEAQA